MNFEQLITRLIDGLNIISNHVDPDTKEVAAHSNIVMVPGLTHSDFLDLEVETLQDSGWTWNDDTGWVFPAIG